MSRVGELLGSPETDEELQERIDDLEADKETLQDELAEAKNEPELVELGPPDFADTRWPGQTLLKTWRYLRKRRRIVGGGYVEWYLIDDSFSQPKYVKPERGGSGIPEYEHGNETYLFPRRARVPSTSTGAWVTVHKKGDADPINLRDPADVSVPADVLQETLNMSVATSPPGLLDKLDLDPDNMLKLLVIGVIGFALLQEVLGGGVF